MAYTTPDVYIKEVSTLPPSVAEVATAVPAFIGFVEYAIDDKGNKVQPYHDQVMVRRIGSMLEFERNFGGPAPMSGIVTDFSGKLDFIKDTHSKADKYFLYQALQHFYANGGGNAYVVAAGSHAGPLGRLLAAADESARSLAEEARKNAIVNEKKANPDKVEAHYFSIGEQAFQNTYQNNIGPKQQSAKDQYLREALAAANPAAEQARTVAKMTTPGDEQAKNTAGERAYKEVLDTAEKNAKDIIGGQEQPEKAFLAGIAAASLIDEVTLLLCPEATVLQDKYYNTIVATMLAQASKLGDRFVLIDGDGTRSPDQMSKQLRNHVAGTVETLKYGAAYYPNLRTTLSHSFDTEQIVLNGFGETKTLAALLRKEAGSQRCQQVLALLNEQPVILPPSAAVAGVYAQVDGSRGVWKAPANVPLAMVTDTSYPLSNDQQGDLNVDATAGKSINAIRAFTGKGILVWGARTLAGNDNEWRYVNVRRLFNMVEESVKKATAFAVFEPNTPLTWLKVKSMIDSYLTGLWKDGALFGDTAEQAFFVTVGLGTTMTEDDINNGRLNIKIGLAAVRPAEFIELAFSHKSISA